VWQESTFEPGASWKMMLPDGRVADTGEILEADKPHRLVIKWRNEFREELKAEGWSKCTITLEPISDTVKLMIVHEIDTDPSKFIDAVSGGWPKILSGLKSYLETGAAFTDSPDWSKEKK
jgi:uncharacterized protein YndB with AHSA1/START domain